MTFSPGSGPGVSEWTGVFFFCFYEKTRGRGKGESETDFFFPFWVCASGIDLNSYISLSSAEVFVYRTLFYPEESHQPNVFIFTFDVLMSLDHADFDLLGSHRLLGLHMLLVQLAQWSSFR